MESVGVLGVGSGKGCDTLPEDAWVSPGMKIGGREVRNAAVEMLMVVPSEEALAPRSCGLQARKEAGVVRPVLQALVCALDEKDCRC